ncbi:bacillopeptidase F (M6 metalloprotease family) [Neobacillus niacini]|uniref:hypothetical protein n=1 Tax=Neobacillus driksii TaxID=3035913 RepID=UPI00277F4040|nr:hypothetical protein [Neobacillus niacini]MDQ0970421.1 bacillopeptidase F (M6 metalloprotease family) [Neobacillus niacini]
MGKDRFHLAGPFEAAARTDGEWTHVDLTDKNIFVTGDSYLVYVQLDAVGIGKIPSLKSNHNSTFHDRNWFLENGTWEHNTDPQYGNRIRAVMNSAISASLIGVPQENTHTNQVRFK